MTDKQIESRLLFLIPQERNLTVEILLIVAESQRREFYLQWGYSSVFDWLLRRFGYSHSSAQRRVLASRLLDRDGRVPGWLGSSELKLSVAAEVETVLRREERRRQKKIPAAEVGALLEKLLGKTEDAARAVLGETFPESVSRENSLRSLNEEESRLNVVLTRQAREVLERSREMLSHAMPDASWSDVIECGLDDFLNRWDPLRRKTPCAAGAAAQGAISRVLRAVVLQRAGGKCEFVGSTTGIRCESRYQIEVDHIHPRALGGTNDPENLRALCRSHNQSEAERHGLGIS